MLNQQNQLKSGDIVTWKNPASPEEQYERYTVLEVNADRCLIRYINPDLSIPPTTLAKTADLISQSQLKNLDDLLRYLFSSMTRNELIAELVHNDPNGCYTDEDCDAEGLPCLTRTELMQLITETIIDDLI